MKMDTKRRFKEKNETYARLGVSTAVRQVSDNEGSRTERFNVATQTKGGKRARRKQTSRRESEIWTLSFSRKPLAFLPVSFKTAE